MNAKKTVTKLLKVFLLVVLFTGFFVSCNNIVDGSETKYSFKPDVKALDGKYSGIGITSRYRSDKTDFIYIYRVKIPGPAESAKDPENIGIINQKAYKNTNTFLFQDQFVEEDAKYRYKTIYHDSETDEYFASGWSNEISAKQTYGVLKYKSCPDITYSETKSTLTIPSGSDFNKLEFDFDDPTPTVEGYVPALILTRYITSGNSTSIPFSRYFPITSEENIKNDTVVDYINLRDLVSDDFLNTPITISGLVGMKIEYTEETSSSPKVQKAIYFSSAYSPKIINPADEILITTFQGTGIYCPTVSN